MSGQRNRSTVILFVLFITLVLWSAPAFAASSDGMEKGNQTVQQTGTEGKSNLSELEIVAGKMDRLNDLVTFLSILSILAIAISVYCLYKLLAIKTSHVHTFPVKEDRSGRAQIWEQDQLSWSPVNTVKAEAKQDGKGSSITEVKRTDKSLPAYPKDNSSSVNSTAGKPFQENAYTNQKSPVNKAVHEMPALFSLSQEEEEKVSKMVADYYNALYDKDWEQLFINTYEPVFFGVANYKERRENPAIPVRFEEKRTGEFLGARLEKWNGSDVLAVFPRFELTINEANYQWGAIEDAFNCRGYYRGKEFQVKKVDSPSIFTVEQQKNWIMRKKGELIVM